MGIATALFAIAAAAIATAWAWLGATVQMPPSPLGAGGKLYCVSYTPFRGAQTPLGPDVPVDPRQIDEDLAQLKHITDCVRTYSVDHGLDPSVGDGLLQRGVVLDGLVGVPVGEAGDGPVELVAPGTRRWYGWPTCWAP